MKTWKLTVNEDELQCLIKYHNEQMSMGDFSLDHSARIHDLTKRLNKDTPDIERDEPKQDATETQQPPTPPATQGWG